MTPSGNPEPQFVLRSSPWATGALRNPVLYLYDEHLEVRTPGRRRAAMHRLRYDEIATFELVPGRFFTDVIVGSESGAEVVVAGIRNDTLDPALPFLAVSVGSRADP